MQRGRLGETRSEVSTGDIRERERDREREVNTGLTYLVSRGVRKRGEGRARRDGGREERQKRDGERERCRAAA